MWLPVGFVALLTCSAQVAGERKIEALRHDVVEFLDLIHTGAQTLKLVDRGSPAAADRTAHQLLPRAPLGGEALAGSWSVPSVDSWVQIAEGRHAIWTSAFPRTC